MKIQTKDEGVTSVIGEMLIIALVLILTSLFAISAFNLLPGERDTVVTVAMEYSPSENTISFWHKGGDWIDGKELTASITLRDGGEKKPLDEIDLKDCHGEKSEVFDLGGCYTVNTAGIESGVYSLRLSTENSVIYAEDGVNI